MIPKLLAAALFALVAAPLFSLHYLPRVEARLSASGALCASLVSLEPVLPGSLF